MLESPFWIPAGAVPEKSHRPRVRAATETVIPEAFPGGVPYIIPPIL